MGHWKLDLEKLEHLAEDPGGAEGESAEGQERHGGDDPGRDGETRGEKELREQQPLQKNEHAVSRREEEAMGEALNSMDSHRSWRRKGRSN